MPNINKMRRYIIPLILAMVIFTGCSNEFDPKIFCDNETVAKVYDCGDNIEIVSSLLGGGSSYYTKSGNKKFTCPIVAPDSMSKECKEIFDLKINSNYLCTEVC